MLCKYCLAHGMFYMLLVIPLLRKDLRAGTMSNAPERLIAVPACASLRVTRELERSVPLRLINQEQVQRTLRGRGSRWKQHHHPVERAPEGGPPQAELRALRRGCGCGPVGGTEGLQAGQANCKLPVGVSASLTGGVT